MEDLSALFNNLYTPVRNELRKSGCTDQYFGDIYQDAFFIILQEKNDEGNKIKYPLTYITHICIYLWIKERKRQNKLEPVEESEKSFDPPNGSQDDLIKLMLKHMENLPPACKKILTLYSYGYNESNISRLMDLTDRAAVKNKKFYCKEKLRFLIKKDPLYKEIHG